MTSNLVKPILGTMNFGIQVNEYESEAMIYQFLDSRNLEIDTAYVYNDGETERILGSILEKPEFLSVKIATKVNPRVTGKLDAESVNLQVSESIKRLRRGHIDLLYLHFPDPSTPIAETLAACAALYADGKIKALGLSNYPAWQVVDIWNVCQKHDWLKPTVYQGLYNPLSRKAEFELFPSLRELGIRFYAYNPLAGGLLSGKYKDFNETPVEGRFTYRPNYKNRYWKKSLFEAMFVINSACELVQISIAEAVFRYLVFSSKLSDLQNSGILIGTSKIEQLKANLYAFNKGPLPLSVADSFEVAWDLARQESPEYFQSVAK